MTSNVKPSGSMPYGKSKPVPDSFQAFLVEGAYFTDTEEYPVIPRPSCRDHPLRKSFRSKRRSIIRGICLTLTYVRIHQMQHLNESEDILGDILTSSKGPLA